MPLEISNGETLKITKKDSENQSNIPNDGDENQHDNYIQSVTGIYAPLTVAKSQSQLMVDHLTRARTFPQGN